ncbi:TetR/AcrR family transcriptional regulator [Variovorax humicola]|uniref:TetR/AcrR family transcriptional regulator n=1 Tax=Variovorax humicola TaxID=1769758 RepID=A0ABU8W3D4_9BURK
MGRSSGAFYRHYESKEALLHELLGEFKQRLTLEVTKPMQANEDPIQNLLQRTGAFWRVYRENWPIVTAAFQLSMRDEGFATAWQSARQQGIRAMASVIRQAQALGHAPGMDADLAASALCSMLEFTCYNWMATRGDFPNRDIDDATAIEVLSQLVVHAIGWRTSLK